MSFDFLDDEEKLPQQDHLYSLLPDWVSEKNATLKAYNAINSIKLDKLEYIQKNKTKHAFRTQKLYQVKTEEVATKVGVTPQVLFHTSTYSDSLKSFLKEINDELRDKKIKRLEAKPEGVRARPKTEVYESYQSCKKDLVEVKKKNASDQVSEAISRMSTQTRNKLGL